MTFAQLGFIISCYLALGWLFASIGQFFNPRQTNKAWVEILFLWIIVIPATLFFSQDSSVDTE